MQTVKFRPEMCTDAPSDSIFSGPATYVLAILCVLMKVLSHASAKKKTKMHKCFKFRTVNGRLQVTSCQ